MTTWPRFFTAWRNFSQKTKDHAVLQLLPQAILATIFLILSSFLKMLRPTSPLQTCSFFHFSYSYFFLHMPSYQVHHSSLFDLFRSGLLGAVGGAVSGVGGFVGTVVTNVIGGVLEGARHGKTHGKTHDETHETDKTDETDETNETDKTMERTAAQLLHLCVAAEFGFGHHSMASVWHNRGISMACLTFSATDLDDASLRLRPALQGRGLRHITGRCEFAEVLPPCVLRLFFVQMCSVLSPLRA